MDTLIDAARSVLVLVDYQQRLLPSLHGGDAALRRGVRLGAIARTLGVPVIGTEQNPRGLGPNDEAVRAACGLTIAKSRFDACADGLLEAIAAARTPVPSEAVIAGCEAHVCLMQTALGLLRAGLRVRVVADACASRSAGSHALAMQRLQAAGATIVAFEMVAFEWLGGCEHPDFRTVLRIVKDS